MIRIKPYIKRRNGQFECHRLQIIGTGSTRKEAWQAMWNLYYGNVVKPRSKQKENK